MSLKILIEKLNRIIDEDFTHNEAGQIAADLAEQYSKDKLKVSASDECIIYAKFGYFPHVYYDANNMQFYLGINNFYHSDKISSEQLQNEKELKRLIFNKLELSKCFTGIGEIYLFFNPRKNFELENLEHGQSNKETLIYDLGNFYVLARVPYDVWCIANCSLYNPRSVIKVGAITDDNIYCVDYGDKHRYYRVNPEKPANNNVESLTRAEVNMKIRQNRI